MMVYSNVTGISLPFLLWICLIMQLSFGRYVVNQNVNIWCTNNQFTKLVSCSVIIGRENFTVSHSTLDRPTETSRAIHQFLCVTYDDTCSFIIRHQLESLFSKIIGDEVRQYWFVHSIFAQRSFENYMMQKFVHKAAITYHNNRFVDYATENLDAKSIKSSPLSFSVIISAHFCPSAGVPDCEEILDFRSSYHNWLQQMKEELEEELPGYGTAAVIYGSKHLEDKEDKRKFYQQCQEIRQTFSYTIPIECVILSEDVFSVEHGHDYREPLAKLAYEKFNSDFYVLAQVNILHLRGWLQITTYPLLNKGLYNGFGIVLKGCPWRQYLPENLFYESAWHEFPAYPVLQRGHFEVFGSMKIFLPYVPLSINNYLLFDIYETFQSVFCNEQYTVSISSLTFSAEFLAIADIYVLHVEHVRRYAKRKLEQMKYGLAPLLLNDSVDIAYSPRDALYPLYCNAKHNCPAGESIIQARSYNLSVAKVQTTIRREVYCAAASHSPRGKVLCSSSKTKSSQQEEMVKFIRKYPTSVYRNENAKVAVITAIIGNYEATAKRFARQTIATDFICFTDRDDIRAPGWIVETAPYHLMALEQEYANNWTNFRNAYTANQHPFNSAKYYKQQFHHIPLLQQYDVIIWIDGTIEINDENMTAKMLTLFATKAKDASMIVFEHIRDADLKMEVSMSMPMPRYTNSTYLGHEQPVQDIAAQYYDYVSQGFTLQYWNQVRKEMKIQDRKQYGLWCTCFVAWNMKRPEAKTFLDAWAMENRRHTTQDQVSFPFIVQKERIHPYSLPDDTIFGSFDANSMFIKGYHGW